MNALVLAAIAAPAIVAFAGVLVGGVWLLLHRPDGDRIQRAMDAYTARKAAGEEPFATDMAAVSDEVPL